MAYASFMWLWVCAQNSMQAGTRLAVYLCSWSPLYLILILSKWSLMCHKIWHQCHLTSCQNEAEDNVALPQRLHLPVLNSKSSFSLIGCSTMVNDHSLPDYFTRRWIIYIYIYMCVCVCVCEREREREKEREKEIKEDWQFVSAYSILKRIVVRMSPFFNLVIEGNRFRK